MDIICHGIAGASTGFYYGKPVLGALIGISPDLVLGVKRQLRPTTAYNLTHSLILIAFLGHFCWFLLGNNLVLFALLSHLFLDMPTHGKLWAPPLLYPFSNKRFSLGSEWEWFSKSWQFGLSLTIFWSLLWLNL